MKILLVATAYNSLTQRVQAELDELGHETSVELALSDSAIYEAAALFQPDLILAPILKTAIPEKVWSKYRCIIIHPGPEGDRGPSSLDWAISLHAKTWGVTLLQATGEMDAGPVWASVNFPMRTATKSSIYRNEVTSAAVRAVHSVVKLAESPDLVPALVDYSDPKVFGLSRPSMKQWDRKLNWTESTADIIRKIHAADSWPGVLDLIYNESFYLFGAHEESELKGLPGAILAKRHGAICRATGDGAVWITHLRRKKVGNANHFKLPATVVLGGKLRDIPELRVDLVGTPGHRTYRDIWYTEKNYVGCLHFDFYNGAMSTEQCRRLLEAYRFAKSRPTRAIMLMGGADFFSNGIDLNLIEAAVAPAAESWANINALNDLVYEILTTETHLTISALTGNAGAGGVMLAIAADKVVARNDVILNPHYKGMGNLYGSEYWTYSLPRRVGLAKARELTNNCLPVGTKEALKIGLIDIAFGESMQEFCGLLQSFSESAAESPNFHRNIRAKKEGLARDNLAKPFSKYREEELERMWTNFYGPDQSYHFARARFVHKLAPLQTPPYLAKHRSLHVHFARKKQTILAHELAGKPPY
jgi:putative two-component system protein, hydrogenase maturation factor HypX/HoxX